MSRSPSIITVRRYWIRVKGSNLFIVRSMSLYQQGYYAHPANSAPAFSPPVAGYSGPAAYPSPSLSLSPPIHHHDPASFRRQFTNCLAELSFNSRLIIQGLATIARDHTCFADVVVECIENHIRGVSHSFAIIARVYIYYFEFCHKFSFSCFSHLQMAD